MYITMLEGDKPIPKANYADPNHIAEYEKAIECLLSNHIKDTIMLVPCSGGTRFVYVYVKGRNEDGKIQYLVSETRYNDGQLKFPLAFTGIDWDGKFEESSPALIYRSIYLKHKLELALEEFIRDGKKRPEYGI